MTDRFGPGWRRQNPQPLTAEEIRLLTPLTWSITLDTAAIDKAAREAGAAVRAHSRAMERDPFMGAPAAAALCDIEARCRIADEAASPDTPTCQPCGTIMVRAWKCLNCGAGGEVDHTSALQLVRSVLRQRDEATAAQIDLTEAIITALECESAADMRAVLRGVLGVP